MCKNTFTRHFKYSNMDLYQITDDTRDLDCGWLSAAASIYLCQQWEHKI